MKVLGTMHLSPVDMRYDLDDWPRPSVLGIAERSSILQSLREIAPASSVRVDWTRGIGVNVANALDIPFNDAAQIPASRISPGKKGQETWQLTLGRGLGRPGHGSHRNDGISGRRIVTGVRTTARSDWPGGTWPPEIAVFVPLRGPLKGWSHPGLGKCEAV